MKLHCDRYMDRYCTHMSICSLYNSARFLYAMCITYSLALFTDFITMFPIITDNRHSTLGNKKQPAATLKTLLIQKTHKQVFNSLQNTNTKTQYHLISAYQKL